MKNILVVLFSFLFSICIPGQIGIADNKISAQDQILLQKFWTDFTDAVMNNNKEKIKTLCEFPFYCRPCRDDTESKNSNHLTVKVTRDLFHKKHYKIFFEKPLKTEVKKYKNFNIQFFHPYFNQEVKRHGIYFLYTLAPPSEHWEGAQGMITLRKSDGKFKITGIDTIP